MSLSVTVHGFQTQPGLQTAGRWATAEINSENGENVTVYTVPSVGVDYMILAVSITNKLAVTANYVSLALSDDPVRPRGYEFIEFNSSLVPSGTLERTQLMVSPGQKIIVRWGIEYPDNSLVSDSDGSTMLVSSTTPAPTGADQLQLESRAGAPTQSGIANILSRYKSAFQKSSGARFDLGVVSTTVNGQVATLDFTDNDHVTPFNIGDALELGTLVGDFAPAVEPFAPVTLATFTLADPTHGDHITLNNTAPANPVQTCDLTEDVNWSVGDELVGVITGAVGVVSEADQTAQRIKFSSVTGTFETGEGLFIRTP